MSEQQQTGDDDGLGQPIAELRDLSLAVDERFERRIHSSIERRVLTRDALNLAWEAPKMMLLELLRFLFAVPGGPRRP